MSVLDIAREYSSIGIDLGDLVCRQLDRAVYNSTDYTVYSSIYMTVGVASDRVIASATNQALQHIWDVVVHEHAQSVSSHT